MVKRLGFLKVSVSFDLKNIMDNVIIIFIVGLSPAVQSVAPFLAIQQCLYDISKLTVSDTSYGKHPATFIACGALSGAVAQTVSNNTLKFAQQNYLRVM